MTTNDFNGWTNAELIEEINKLNRARKLGLVWETRAENLAESISNQISVFEDVRNKTLNPKKQKPFNFLVEGDNLQALSAMNFTHKEKIDVIYIDPPYNTGNNDFKYNDSFVLKDDSFRHSSWLSFMSKRLWLAKDLLKKEGVIIISIDDNEQAHLKLLCDEIFGENNFVACLPTIMNLKGNQDEFAFAGTHEYTLIYAKDKSSSKFNNLAIESDDIAEEWQQDDIGWWKKGAGLKMTGINAPREKQPSLYFPVWVNKDGTDLSLEEKKGWFKILPVTDGHDMSWRWSKDKFLRDKGDVIISGSAPNWTFYKKQRPELGDLPSKKPKSTFYKPQYSTTNGASQIKAIFGSKVFDYPKPLELIMDLLEITTTKNSLVLDFFAGSGTTGHAVEALNKKDDGNRRYILCTNNENEIAEKITYQRLKKIADDISNLRSFSNLPTNLKYFKIKSLSNIRTYSSKKNIVNKINTLVQFKEDAFQDLEKNEKFSIFKNEAKLVAVILDEDFIEEFKSQISELEYESINVYIFAYGNDGYEDYFEDLTKNINLIPIPLTILNAFTNAYRRAGVSK